MKMINLDDYTVNESNVVDEQIVINDGDCETIYKGYDCFDYYRCCDCGGNNCGCLGCFSCNACDVCKCEQMNITKEETNAYLNMSKQELQHEYNCTLAAYENCKDDDIEFYKHDLNVLKHVSELKGLTIV